jgi:hypothetical protein
VGAQQKRREIFRRVNGPLDDVKGGKAKATAHRPTPACATFRVEVVRAQFMEEWASLRSQNWLPHCLPDVFGECVI